MKKWIAAALAALTALTLTGCSFQDVMLYLYGGDSFVTSAEPDYTTCDGDNGVTVVYDQNQWEQPVMAQDDTLSLTTGNQLSYTQLTSDADGVVAAITGEAGQVTAAGTPMVTIVRSGEREIQINVPENVKLSIGQQAEISFWALPDVTAKGTVREISPIADSITRTYKVRVAVPQLPAAAKLGMTAKVSFKDAAAAADELVIPATALYQVNGKTQVWLVRNNRAVLQDVKVAGYVGNNVRLAGGLNKGDILITAGLSKLVDNQQVRLTKGGDI